MAPGGHEADIFDFRIQPRFADAKAFLGHLRGLGAHVPKGGAAPLSPGALRRVMRVFEDSGAAAPRSEEQTSELQSLMSISYAVLCVKKKETEEDANKTKKQHN